MIEIFPFQSLTTGSLMTVIEKFADGQTVSEFHN